MESQKKNYYDLTKNAKPHMNVEKFISLNIDAEKAIDLGCGAGRDTVELLKNNWKVLSIDKENTRQIIEEQLNNIELKNFEFIQGDFTQLPLQKTNLIVANFSIPFCNKEYFKDLWKKLNAILLNEGYFVGNFFGKNDSWINSKKNMVFLSKKEVMNLFNDFEIIQFKDIEKDTKTVEGELKHWHVYDIIAKKNKIQKFPVLY